MTSSPWSVRCAVLVTGCALLASGCSGGGTDAAPSASASGPRTSSSGSASPGSASPGSASPGSAHRFGVRAVLAERPATPAGASPADPGDPPSLDADVAARWRALRCPAPAADDDPARPLLACSAAGDTAYALGPAELTGADVARAAAVPEPGGSAGSWTVVVDLTPAGAQALRRTTRRLAALPGARAGAALVVDGVVVSAPRVAEEITGGRLQVAGAFTEPEARALAARIPAGR